MKRNKRNAGLSMSELLFVMALIALFSAFGLVHIRAQKKNLDFMESNETAKEIFLAAQEHLSAAYTKRELHTDPTSTNYALYSLLNLSAPAADNDAFGVPIHGNLYALYMKNGAAAKSASSGDPVALVEAAPLAYQIILPQGSIVTNRNYAVLYDRNAYRIGHVFYTTENYDFSSWKEIDWERHLTQVDSADGENYLKNFPTGDGRKIVMGFYSETIVPGGGSIGSGDPLSHNDPFALSLDKTTPPANGINPGLTIVNGSVLYALVNLDNSFDYTSVTLDLEEVGGNGACSIPFTDFTIGSSSSKNIVWRLKEADTTTTTYVVVLDDVTPRSTVKFSDISGGNITPGANVQATVNTKGKVKNASSDELIEGASNSVIRNTLFADGSDLSKTVHVQNFRHLQNLDKCNSVGSLSAELDQSLGWSAFINDIRDNYRKNIFPLNPDDRKAPIPYDPVSPNYELTFESANNRIYNIMGLELPGGDAGLFGTLTKKTEIERIQMQNTTVTGSPTNAGALISVVSGGTVGEPIVRVNQVASYGEKWATASDDGVATTITALQSAGGLIGTVTGGNVTLTGCAAAHLVGYDPDKTTTAVPNNAGGLVGSVTGGGLTIEYSYAGSGQVVASGDSIEYEYTGPVETRKLKGNIQGDNAGGLVGYVASGGTATLNNVYSTASAYGTSKAGDQSTKYLIGAGLATISGDAYSSGDYQTEAQVATGKNNKGAPLSATDSKASGNYYQKKLFGKEFPYKTVAMMGASLNAPWLSKHIGDWTPMANLPTANWGIGVENKTVKNDNVRYAWIQIPANVTLINDSSIITLAVSNPKDDADEEAKTAVLYAYKYNESTLESVGLSPMNYKVGNATKWETSVSGPKMVKDIWGPSGKTTSSGDKIPETWFRVPLDDITTSGNRFKDLYVSVNSALSADAPVVVRAGVGTIETEFSALRIGAAPVTWDPTDPTSYPNTAYVLFDVNSEEESASLQSVESGDAAKAAKDYTAAITNVRHLQNLDTTVSGVGAAVTEATLAANLDWTTWQGRTIQLNESKTATSFYGISNANLTKFDGNGKTLTNFTIDRTASGDSAPEKSAGLFRELNGGASGATVENLTLTNFTVKAGGNANAAALIASATGAVTVKNVTLDNSGNAAAAITAGTDGKAGGLIASATGATIENVTLSRPEVTATGTGAAAGLIANATGNVTLNNAVTLNNPTVKAQGTGNAAGLVAHTGGNVLAGAATVTLTSPTVTAGGNGNAAGLVADAQAVTLKTANVNTNATITAVGTGNAAGLVAHTSGNVTLQDTVTLTSPTVKAQGTGNAAGLVADAQAVTLKTANVNTNATITAVGTGNAAGLVANATGNVTLQDTVTLTSPTVEAQGTTGSGNAAGLVAHTDGNVIADAATVTLSSPTVTAKGNGNAAGLVANADAVTIKTANVQTRSEITAEKDGNAAGLVADATGNVTLQDTVTLSSPTVTAKGNGNAAGLVADAQAVTLKTANVNTNATITAVGTGHAAGLVADATGNVTLQDTVTLTSPIVTAQATSGSGNAAGLVAHTGGNVIAGAATVTLTSPTVTASGNGNAAGLVASATGDVTVKTANVNTNATITAVGTGHAAGLVADATGNVTLQDTVTLTSPTVEAQGTGNAAGLIASATGAVTIQNGASNPNAVTLTGANVTAANGNAAGLIASATGAVTVKNATLGDSSDANKKAKVNASGTGDAAGLVADAQNGATIENVKLYSPEVKATGTSGDAAGLIAKASGAVTIQNSASATDKNAVTLTSPDISTTTGNAGGLIASVASGDAMIQNLTTDTDAFTLEKFSVTTTTGDAGGLIGSVASGASATIQNTQTAANASAHTLTLEKPTVQTTKGDAGGLIAKALGAVTVKNVTLGNPGDATNNYTPKDGPTVTANEGAAAGLIASASADNGKEIKIENVRIEEPTVTAGTEATAGANATNGDAGGLIASAKGTVSVNTVLVRSKSNSVSANGKGAAGGLVGAAKGNLTLDNSAATIYVKAANGDAGGLIGTVASGAATVTDSYAGGHTSGGEYRTTVSGDGRWNVQSSDAAAGGLVGSVANDATLNAAQSFSAASVNGATAAGGVVGATADGATVNFSGSVYAAGPVDNVSEQAKAQIASPDLDKITNAGAFIGAGNITLQHAFYLPQVYKDAELYKWTETFTTSNIAYRGATTVSGSATAVSYGDDTSAIAGKKDMSLLELETKPYDVTNAQAEYPFAVWTQFSFDGALGPYYYGDFEVVQNTPSIEVNVYFKYQLPDGTPQDVTGTGGNPVVRTVSYSKDDGLGVIPASLPPKDGYRFDHWELSPNVGAGGTSVRLQNAQQQDFGQYDALEITRNQIVLEAKYEPKADVTDANGAITQDNSATRIITINAVYKADPDNRTVEYYVPADPADPEHSAYTLLTSESVMKASGTTKVRKKWNELNPPPAPVKTGYAFLGFYKTKTGGTAVNFDSAAALTDADAGPLYARFEKITYFYVEAEFVYLSGQTKETCGTWKDRYRIGDNAKKQEFALLDTNVSIAKVYKNDSEIRDWATYVTGRKFNFKGALSDADKKTDATTKFTIEYASNPTVASSQKSWYTVQYVYKNSKAVSSGTLSEWDTKILNAANAAKPNSLNAPPTDITYDESESATVTRLYAEKQDDNTTKTVFEEDDIPAPLDILGFSLAPGEEGVKYDDTVDATHKGTKDLPYVLTYTYERKQYLLTFDSLGGTPCNPLTRSYGQPIGDEINARTPTRRGYTLVTPQGSTKWQWRRTYQNEETKGVGKDDAMPADNMTAIVNKWVGDDSSYVIIVWKQRVDSPDERLGDAGARTYDYYTHEVVAEKAGAHVKAGDTADATGAGGTNYASSNYITSSDELKQEFTGFSYSRTVINRDGAADERTTSDESDNAVRGDGSTVVNVYYDRQVRNIDFYWRLKKDCVEKASSSSSSTAQRYGILKVEGVDYYVPLTYSNSEAKWLDRNGETYSGTQYVLKSSTFANDTQEGVYLFHERMTGLYGQTLEQRHYSWNHNRQWKEAATSEHNDTSFLTTFNYQYKTLNLFTQGDVTKRYTITHYQQNLTLGNDYTQFDVVQGLMNLFQFSSKYTGFTVDHYEYQDKDKKTITGNAWDAEKKEGHPDGGDSEVTYGEYDTNQKKMKWGGWLKVYHVRHVHTLSVFIAGNEKTNAEQSIPYDKSLADVKSLLPTPNPKTEIYEDEKTWEAVDSKYYWNGKWYSDPDCTVEFDWTRKMPDSNLAVYAKFSLPEYTVKFDLTNSEPPGVAASYGNTDETRYPHTLTVEKNSTLASIANANGFLPAYTPSPTTEDYEFAGWFYKDKDGLLKQFNEGLLINDEAATDGTLELYPRYNYVGVGPRSVEIRCFDGKDYLPFAYDTGAFTYDNKVLTEADMSYDEATNTLRVPGLAVGKQFTVDQDKILLPDEYSAYHYKWGRYKYVSVNKENNVIVLRYVGETWSYQFEYWARLRNMARKSGETWLPDSVFDSGESYAKLPATWTVSGLTGETAEPTLVTPRATDAEGKVVADPAYGGYLVAGYRLASEDTNKSAPIHSDITPDDSVLLVPGDDRSDPVVVRVYLELDPTKIKLKSDNHTYNGDKQDWALEVTDDAHKWTAVGERTQDASGQWVQSLNPPANLTHPAGVTYVAYRKYWDLSDRETDDSPKSIEAPVDAGTYAETAYITAVYSKDGEADRTYLLWKSADYDKSESYLTVTPCDVTLTSDNGEWPYDGEVHEAKTVRVTNGGFIARDVQTTTDRVVPDRYVTFAVDAFRRNKGTTSNVFTINLPGTTAKNYNITKEYGTLTVN